MFGWLVCWPAAAQGAVLTFAFEGTVNVVADPLGILGFVHTGDRVIQTFTFDTEAPDTNPTVGYDVYQGTSTSLVIAGVSFGTGAPIIQIGHPLDIFDVSFPVSLDSPELIPGGSAYFRLSDQAESNALTDTLLPTLTYDLSLFQFAEFWINLYAPPVPPAIYDTWLRIAGSLDRMYLVPEPSTLLLLPAGGLLLGRLGPVRRR